MADFEFFVLSRQQADNKETEDDAMFKGRMVRYLLHLQSNKPTTQNKERPDTIRHLQRL
jgi:hypothetical protein